MDIMKNNFVSFLRNVLILFQNIINRFFYRILSFLNWLRLFFFGFLFLILFYKNCDCEIFELFNMYMQEWMNPRVMDDLLVEGELLEEVENNNEKVNDNVLKM